jgi:hypothetical protein
MKRNIFCISFLLFFIPSLIFSQTKSDPTAIQKAWISAADKHLKNGWIYLHTEGGPEERGFQHGYLLADDISQGIASTIVCWENMSAMPWSWLIEKSSDMFAEKIDPENLAEMQGIVDGMTVAGKKISFSEILAYNAWVELSAYWWPQELKKMDVAYTPLSKESCSAFIATGSMTSDGQIVMGHNTMTEYEGSFTNIIIDIVPEKGHRILMQTVAGWIHSGSDFFVTDAGLVGCETTIGDFSGFDSGGIPEFCRMRRATQDAGNIDEWCNIILKGNNGGYANAWLLGDVNTGEIARYELGLKFTGFERTKDGYYAGSNVAENNQILRFETTTNEVNIRDMAIARKVRWKQLMTENKGKIDLEKAKMFEADHFDTFREKEILGGRGLCCHAELESEDCVWPSAPYYPAGTMDGKVIDSNMAKQMSFSARWGSACGLAFDASDFLVQHPQFDWMKDILEDRPSEPWVVFKAGEKK